MKDGPDSRPSPPAVQRRTLFQTAGLVGVGTAGLSLIAAPTSAHSGPDPGLDSDNYPDPRQVYARYGEAKVPGGHLAVSGTQVAMARQLCCVTRLPAAWRVGHISSPFSPRQATASWATPAVVTSAPVRTTV